MSHKIKAVNGVSINVEEIGTGKPIVFIHGWPVNHKMFEYQFTELPKKGYRCIGIDLRGYGDSDINLTKPVSTYEKLVQWLPVVRDHL